MTIKFFKPKIIFKIRKLHIFNFALVLFVTLIFQQFLFADDYSSQCNALNTAATTSQQNLLSKMQGCWYWNRTDTLSGYAPGGVFLVINPTSTGTTHIETCLEIMNYVENNTNLLTNQTTPQAFFNGQGKITSSQEIYSPADDTITLSGFTINNGTTFGDLTFHRANDSMTGFLVLPGYSRCLFDNTIFNN